ncbi:NAD-dependent protein deacetylase sirtuin-2-like protein [Leptotrombidium deliense]|uniref:NAD-dependent protein deacetylase sirtuin-2-like protein n=1 Tax=Leptotrombidium deliense TaxID=299467 RepID=A0A443SKP1_9ACAR|nr:NAD-dependent protein deacetylase sirtuin-2-like protein [Leptotrombidium deliense]
MNPKFLPRYYLLLRNRVIFFARCSHQKSSKNDNKTEKPRADHEEKKEDDSVNLDASLLAEYFRKAMGFGSSKPEKEEKVLDELSFQGIVKYMKSDKCKKIVAMVGAGISTSAGIPDFRSPGSGLYANLAKYNLPYPEAIFDINFFKENPTPFFQLAKELFPGKFNPTPSHYFLKLLEDKGMLLRVYTQNIDGLERRAGIPDARVVEAHGTCYTSHCVEPSCGKEFSLDWMKGNDQIPHCDNCNALVKPDIVFFGERLPEKFFSSVDDDFSKCDLLLIIGTSLKVQPFASLIDVCSTKTPRLLINKTESGNSNDFSAFLGLRSGLQFGSKDNYRDVFWKGDCDDGCKQLAESLGWSESLKKLIEAPVTQSS